MSDDSNTAKHYAPNIKSTWLQEVEDDATYITEKRFAEHYEEAARERQKKAQASSNTSVETDKKGK